MELVELLGAGEPVAEFIEVDNRTAEPVQIPFDPDWINRFLGTEISREDMVKTLEALEIHVDGDVCNFPQLPDRSGTSGRYCRRSGKNLRL